MHMYTISLQVNQLIFPMNNTTTVSYLSNIKVDNSISNQVKYVRVNFHIYQYARNYFTLLSLLSNIVHIEYVTRTCGHVGEVASKVNSGGNYCCRCSIKHLMMMSDTVGLLLSSAERRLYALIYIHTSESQLLNNIFIFSFILLLSLSLSLLLTSYVYKSFNILLLIPLISFTIRYILK